jgi:hypothetical protein
MYRNPPFNNNNNNNNNNYMNQQQQQPYRNQQFNNQQQQQQQQQGPLLPNPQDNLPLIKNNTLPLLTTPSTSTSSTTSITSPSPSQSPATLNINPTCSLILRKVPNNLNKVDILQQHFQQFGQIVQIKPHIDDLQDAALVQFTANNMAFSAYKSPQSVLNNRFIRLYWYSAYLKHKQTAPTPPHPPPPPSTTNYQQKQTPNDEPLNKKRSDVKDRLDFNNKTTSDQTNSTESTTTTITDKNGSQNVNLSSNFDSMKIEQQQQQQINKEGTNSLASINAQLESNKKANYESYATAKEIQEENLKKTLLLKMEVQKKTRELIEKQIKDQKLLLQKFETSKSVEEKSQILKLVKQISETIENEREILNDTKRSIGNQFNLQKTATGTPPVATPPPAPHHLLRLDNTRLNKTNFLNQAKRNQIIQNIKDDPLLINQTIPHAPPPMLINKVDNRPKHLLFTGIANKQEKMNIHSFIVSLGCQIEEDDSNSTFNNQNDDTTTMIIHFATRKDAEIVI